MKNRDFDPEKYTISIKKIVEYGESLFVAKVAELPDLAEYGDTFDFVRELALNSIATAYEMCSEQGVPFPSPLEDNDAQDVSGRVTLRLPKNVHRQSIKLAEENGVSLNSYILSCISANNAKVEYASLIQSQLESIKASLESNPYRFQDVARHQFFNNDKADVQHSVMRGGYVVQAMFRNRDNDDDNDEKQIQTLSRSLHFTQEVRR